MSKILAVGTHATDDPTKASLPFITALGAVRSGIEVGIALVAEAAHLAKPGLANGIQGVGFPPLSELLAKVVDSQVPIYV